MLGPGVKILPHREDEAPMHIAVLDAFIERFCNVHGIDRDEVMLHFDSPLYLRCTKRAAERLSAASPTPEHPSGSPS